MVQSLLLNFVIGNATATDRNPPSSIQSTLPSRHSVSPYWYPQTIPQQLSSSSNTSLRGNDLSGLENHYLPQHLVPSAIPPEGMYPTSGS